MSVHSTYYEDPEEYERDLKFEYRKEDLPFYDDDPDNEYYETNCCENCGHCKSFNARKPVIHFSNYIDDKGYVHNNPDRPVKENLSARWSFDEEYIPGNICELTHNQVMDDDYCEDFEEREE